MEEHLCYSTNFSQSWWRPRWLDALLQNNLSDFANCSGLMSQTFHSASRRGKFFAETCHTVKKKKKKRGELYYSHCMKTCCCCKLCLCRFSHMHFIFLELTEGCWNSREERHPGSLQGQLGYGNVWEICLGTSYCFLFDSVLKHLVTEKCVM